MIVLKSTQEKLLSTLQAVAGIVERKHTLPILSNILINKNDSTIEVIANDLEIQIKTKIELSGDQEIFSTTINTRKIIEILKSLPFDQMVTLSSNANKVLLQSAKSRFSLQTSASNDFPLIKEATDYGSIFSIPQKSLKNLISKIYFSMAVHDIRYYLNGILFIAEGSQLTLVATDGHRLALAQTILDVKMPKQEVILPRKTVIELLRLLKDDESMIEMQFALNQAKFTFSKIEFITKLIDGKFPDYNRVIPKENSNILLIGRQELLSGLHRVSILTSDKFKGVRVNIEPGLLKISSSNSENEEAIEELEIDYNGNAVEIGFNVIYLIDALSNMNVEKIKIEFQDENTSVLITAPELTGFQYVVMPMRI
jgi:DNA polymerase III subunit beta